MPKVNIVIPTYNRAHLIRQAVDAALAQSHADRIVTVVDDGSTDGTATALRGYFDHPAFVYVALARNAGTAQAKNVAIALSPAEAITFHDSDDRPHPDKVLVQARTLFNPEIGADPCLNWRLSGREPGTRVDVAAVFTEHELIRADGSRFRSRRALSIVDDFFPNLQMASGPAGDWILVNSGLFRAGVFETWGGYHDCIEEDRELRNRLIMAGEVIWMLPEVLLTKIECADSLTVAAASDYTSRRRAEDRTLLWGRVEEWRRTGKADVSPIDLDGIDVAFVSNPALVAVSNALMTEATRMRLAAALAAAGAREAAA